MGRSSEGTAGSSQRSPGLGASLPPKICEGFSFQVSGPKAPLGDFPGCFASLKRMHVSRNQMRTDLLPFKVKWMDRSASLGAGGGHVPDSHWADAPAAELVAKGLRGGEGLAPKPGPPVLCLLQGGGLTPAPWWPRGNRADNPAGGPARPYVTPYAQGSKHHIRQEEESGPRKSNHFLL